jgi:murein DD-endopeptidase MepM/ murein hydrolase activator NlpD
MKKLKILITVFLISAAIYYLPVFVFSQNETINFFDDNNLNPEVKKINDEIQEKRNKIKKIQEKQEEYSKIIAQKQAERADLANQMVILDNRVAKAELDMESVQIDIDRVNLEIKKTDSEIESKNKQIEREKIQIGSALRLIYKQDEINSLEILLLNNSLSDFLNQTKYLEDINKEIGESLDSLKNYKSQLESEKINLDKQKSELVKLKDDLKNKKQVLAAEKENKNYIFEETMMSEKAFQRLLAQAKQEQAQASLEISNMEKLVREKLSERAKIKLESSEGGFIWPVSKNTITSYFHDPEYPFRFIFEHPAIDIKAGQGSSVKASASGYVAKAKDAGNGYSYIMIIHSDGLSTVYGHVSKIYVNEDDFVAQGQIIGLSGGLPGTPGAGRLSTGSHLHFEIRANGIPVNPLNYLP